MRESEITMRDRWRIPAAAAIAAAAVLTSACGPQYEPVSPNPFPEGSTMHEIAAAGTIKLGASPNQPGLADLNLEQQWEGFNVDLAVHLVGSLGLEAEDIQWVNTTAANRIPYIEQGKIDLFVTALAITPEREEAIAIAGPYMDAVPQLIMRVDDAAAVQTLEDISPGTKVCVLQGSQGQPRVSESIPQAEIVEFNVLTNCIRALEQGTVDAVDSTAPLLAGFVVRKPDELAFAPMTYGEGERWGIGMADGRTDLCEFFDERLVEAFADGTVDALWDQHMGDSGLAAPEEPEEMTSC
jgi:glutamate transport system substrate-binding protein